MGLEELQEMGRRELDAAKGEMTVAAERLEAGKEELKAARKVRVGLVLFGVLGDVGGVDGVGGGAGVVGGVGGGGVVFLWCWC